MACIVAVAFEMAGGAVRGPDIVVLAAGESELSLANAGCWL